MIGVSAFPADWRVCTLDEVSVKIQDGTHFSPMLGGGDYRYITSRNIGNGRLRLDSVEMISESEHRKIYRRCDTILGDLLLTKDGANTGNAAINMFMDEISLLSSVAFIRANPCRAIERYLLQYLLSASGRNQIDDAMTGNAITRLTLAKIKTLQVPMPDVKEQTRIAEALDDADKLIAGIERLIAKKQAIKQGLMQQLLTGRIRLPGFTGGWTPSHLRDVLTVRHGRSQKAVEHPSGTVPIFATGGQIGWADRPLHSKPSVLIGRKGTIDRPQYQSAPFWTVDTLFYTEISAAADPKFLYYVFQTIDWRSMNEASGVPSLSSTRIESVDIHLPSLQEQIAIRKVLDDADAEISLLKGRLTKAHAIKTGMMQQLLTGRIRLPTEVAP